MNIITKSLETQEQSLISEQILLNITNNLNKILFFDIETTGFSPKTSQCYLIGAIYHHDTQWHYIQWFANNTSEEIEILQAFFDFMKDFQVLIHFNGDGFDLPFLIGRCKFFQLQSPEYSFEQIQSYDLFKKARSLKNLLQLENYKQKTIELFLGIHREDIYTGGDLIKVYKDYSVSKDPKQMELLLLHNHDDICGMPALLPVLQYQEVLSCHFIDATAESNDAADYEGNAFQELLLSFKLPVSLPVPISINKGLFSIRGQNDTLKIRVQIFQGILKHYYSNYKDYYYIPDEDEAMHKSVASFVDKSRRIQANAANCYTKKYDNYLPQYEALFSPIFQESNTDKITWFSYQDDFLNHKEQLFAYGSNIIKHIF